MCSLHIRRYIAGQVYEEDDGQLYDHCKENHILAGDNVRWESSGKRGQKRRRCRECLKAKAKRQARERKQRDPTPEPYRPNDLSLTNAIADFETAIRLVRTKCFDTPGPYMDWGDEPDEPNSPTRAEARALCEGCPLLQACGNFAVAAQMPHGVWGGRLVVNGKFV